MDCRFATIHLAPGASRRGSFPVNTGFAGYVKEQHFKSVIGHCQSEIPMPRTRWAPRLAAPESDEGGLVAP